MGLTIPKEDLGLIAGTLIAVYGLLTGNNDLVAAGLGAAGFLKALGSVTTTPTPT